MFAGRLHFGLNKALHIREERLSQKAAACRLLYISDIHLRPTRSGNLVRQVIEAAHSTKVHAILLGGDLIDTGAETEQLREMVAVLARLAPVLAIGGNHDRHVGIHLVRDAVTRGGGQWIHDTTATLAQGTRTIAISGPDVAMLPKADVRILCAHNPCIWKTARHRGYDLVLAGHLHGCQMVAFEFRNRLFPGALFYPYCFLSHQDRSARLVVSRGVSDLVPIRWRCPREVVLCHV